MVLRTYGFKMFLLAIWRVWKTSRVHIPSRIFAAIVGTPMILIAFRHGFKAAGLSIDSLVVGAILAIIIFAAIYFADILEDPEQDPVRIAIRKTGRLPRPNVF